MKKLKGIVVGFIGLVIVFSVYVSLSPNSSNVKQSPGRAPSSVDDETSPPEEIASAPVISDGRVLPQSLPETDLSAIVGLPESDVASKNWINLYYVNNNTSYHADSVNFTLGATTVEGSVKVRKLAASEFQLYPAECLRSVGLRKLVFSKDISIQWTGTETDSRTATLDPQNGIMTYAESIIEEFPSPNVGYFRIEKARHEKLVATRGNEPGLQATIKNESAELEKKEADIYDAFDFLVGLIHHEFYHYLDIKSNYQLIDTKTKIQVEDKEWTSLNPPDFSYGSGGRNAQRKNVADWNTDVPGFLNEYSRASANEDKAEIWAGLFSRPERLQALMASDPVIAKKVALIKQRAQVQCPGIDANFWAKVSQSNKARVDFIIELYESNGSSAATVKIPQL